MDIDRIASQHGSIIAKDVKEYIIALRDLECGLFLDPVRKNLKESGGYAGICGVVIRRYIALHSISEVEKALDGFLVEFGPSNLDILDYNYTGFELWEKLFEVISANRGLSWLISVEPLVEVLSKEYDIPLPRIYQSRIKGIQQDSLLLKEEMSELQQQYEELSQNIVQTVGNMMTCPVTSLYNGLFLKEFLNSS